MSEKLEDQLKELIVERLFLDVEPASIEDDVELSEYGVDSFLLLELIVAMEEMFNVKFEQKDITADVLSGYFGVDGEYVCNSTSSFESFMERYLNFSFPVLSLDEELALIDTDTFKGMKNFPNAESLEVINGVLVIRLNG